VRGVPGRGASRCRRPQPGVLPFAPRRLHSRRSAPLPVHPNGQHRRGLRAAGGDAGLAASRAARMARLPAARAPASASPASRDSMVICAQCFQTSRKTLQYERTGGVPCQGKGRPPRRPCPRLPRPPLPRPRTKLMCWIAWPLEVLTTVSLRGVSAGCSPAPTYATRLVQNSISASLWGGGSGWGGAAARRAGVHVAGGQATRQGGNRPRLMRRGWLRPWARPAANVGGMKQPRRRAAGTPAAGRAPDCADRVPVACRVGVYAVDAQALAGGEHEAGAVLVERDVQQPLLAGGAHERHCKGARSALGAAALWPLGRGWGWMGQSGPQRRTPALAARRVAAPCWRGVHSFPG
jgi:hypothetical protein